MPDLDDYVRAEVDRLARQVETADVLSVVEHRIRRRRVMRTLQVGSLIAVVLAGTASS
jgi:hypothetical protein